MKKYLLLVIGVLTSFVSNAAFIPFGVQNDVDVDTVLNTWGWEIVYRNDYGADGFGAGTSLSAVFSGLDSDDYVMFAALRDGSTKFEVLGAGLFGLVTSVTATNATNLVNGVNWYYNSLSMGFAGAGDLIRQSSADINGLSERDRLSWHTTSASGRNGGIAPDAMWGGWRAGSYTSLNGSTEWDKVVLRYIGESRDVPEPASWAMLALALFSFGYQRRKFLK
ncbi:PEP-CTERM sorting domain-containing protein [Alteromonas sp. CYL-A6]|uniref:PEP-CTERM sorting domain-containing protein n=1 Tax=Alteromonas nitratireducens TaxID=3390813 RepID=UPI0034B82385